MVIFIVGQYYVLVFSAVKWMPQAGVAAPPYRIGSWCKGFEYSYRVSSPLCISASSLPESNDESTRRYSSIVYIPYDNIGPWGMAKLLIKAPLPFM